MTVDHSDVWEALSNTHPVLPLDATTTWEPYYSGYFTHRKWSRYYMSSGDMFASGWYYRWTVVNDCLLIVKWMTMGGRKVLLIVPPMSKHGDLKAEAEVLRWVQAAGVGARLSEEDRILYGLDGCTPCPMGPEFVYRTGDYLFASMTGGRWRDWRGVHLAAAREGWATQLWSGDDLPTDMVGVMEEISDRWAVERSKSGTHTRHVATMSPAMGADGFALVTSHGETPVAWSVYQRLNGQNLVGLAGPWLGETRWPCGDASRYLHMAESQLLADRLGPETLFNLGSPVGDSGMLQAKRIRRPRQELNVYRTPGSRILAPDEWKASRRFR